MLNEEEIMQYVEKIKDAHLKDVPLKNLYQIAEIGFHASLESVISFWLYKAAVYSKIIDLGDSPNQNKLRLFDAINSAKHMALDIENMLSVFILRNNMSIEAELPMLIFKKNYIINLLISHLESIKSYQVMVCNPDQDKTLKQCLKLMLYIYTQEVEQPVNSLIFEIFNDACNV